MIRSLSILFSLLSITSLAQDSGSVKGVVKEDGMPVEFANVFLTLEKDSLKIIGNTVTDSLGRFYMDKLPIADYVLNIRMVGFVTKQIDVSLNAVDMHKDLREIAIVTDVRLLKTLEVNGVRDLIQKTEEGIVMKASDNLTQIGGTAVDLLKNMPGVLVGADGEITLRGRSPLTLINGRVSGITGVDRAAQLERIAASSIDRIEIINNPSAKYDADAEGGVINIILKKNEDNGTHGAFAIGAGRGDRYRLNASMLLNHKAGKWNFGLAYDNWYTTRTRKVNGDRLNFDLPDEYFLTQRRFDERLIFYQNAKTTIDYAPSKKSNLSFEALWAFPGEDNNETLKNTNETSEREFTNRNQRHSNEIRRSHGLEFSLTYVKHFDHADKLLSINVSDAFGYDKENTDITTQILTQQDEFSGTSSIQQTQVYQKTNLNNVAIDFAQPLAERAILEVGYKAIFRYLNSDFERATLENNGFVADPLNSNIFNFNEQIHAIYAQYNGWTGTKEEPVWKYNIGLRAEKVWNRGKTLYDEAFSNEYFNLFPSVNLLYYFENRNNLKASYSRRIVRPGLGQLNPFIDITDSLNQHSGNSQLTPERIHSLELGYYHIMQKGSLSFSAFYRIRSNAIFNYTTLDQNGVALARPFNFGNASTYGLEAIASANPCSFWAINFSMSAYELDIDDTGLSTGLSNRQINWYSKLINNFSLSKNSKLQITGNYSSPIAIPQGKSIAIYFVDLGFQQKIINGKGRLGVVITDVFNTQRSGFITSDYNFTFNRQVKQDTRAIMATFGYTFGTSFKEKLMENRFKND